MKRNLKFYIPLSGCLFLIILLEWATPPPVNWSPSFAAEDRIAYGGYVVYRLLPDLFPGQAVYYTDRPIVENLSAGESAAREDGSSGGVEDPLGVLETEEEETEPFNYLFINDSFTPDAPETAALLRFAAEGNHVFIAAEDIAGPLADSLHVRSGLTLLFNPADSTETMSNVREALSGLDSTRIDFVNPALAQGYDYPSGVASYGFDRFDSLNATILSADVRGQVNFLKMPYGNGVFWLNTVPLAFTNYYALSTPHRDYLEKAFSYLPLRKTLWDNHYKIGRQEARTPLRYILNRPALRWAYVLALVTIGLFIWFEGKRKQRIIPVIPPLQNDTLAFVRTLGGLYYQSRDHKHIAHKIIRHFQERLRIHYGTEIPETLTAEAQKRIADKTGRPVSLVTGVCVAIRDVQARADLTDAEFLYFHHQIEQFKHYRT